MQFGRTRKPRPICTRRGPESTTRKAMTIDKTEDTAGSMRMYADRQLCCGYAACKEACPEIFQIDDEGLLTILNEVVPPELEKAGAGAVDSFPMPALQMEKDGS